MERVSVSALVRAPLRSPAQVQASGAARMAAMAAVTLALVGFFGFVIMRVTTPPMATLFTDLSYEDSSAIIKDLERQGIPYEMKNDGSVIQVPKDKIYNA